MRFSPSKCVVFAPPPAQRRVPLQLYGEDLPATTTAPYLGFPFSPSGINFALLCQERCEKAKGVVAALAGLGYNATGWAPAAAARVYLTFVRPIMEYGVALRLPTPALCSMYQRTQNLALRRLFSAPPNTSIAAMHRVLGIPMFEHRCRELNLLSAARFHNSTDASIIGVDLWRRAVTNTTRPHPRDSLPLHTLTRNPLVIETRPRLLDHSTQPLVHQNPTRLPPPLTAAERRQRRIAHIEGIGAVNPQAAHPDVGASVLVLPSGRAHYYLTAESCTPRPARVTISRWQLGLVAAHQPCHHCSAPPHNVVQLSRNHATEHAEIRDRAAGLVRPVPMGERAGHTEIDQAINAGAEQGWDAGTRALLVEIITDIENICRNRERTPQGFFVPRGRRPAGTRREQSGRS